MRVLGVDPGYERCGVAVIKKHDRDNLDVLFSTCITTSKQDSHTRRLTDIGSELSTIIETYEPVVCAVEKLYFAKNKKTALGVAEARGVILYVAGQKKIEIQEYDPSAVKIAVTGHGQSTKQDIITMLPKLLSLPHEPQHDDEYDALAVAITHCVSA